MYFILYLIFILFQTQYDNVVAKVKATAEDNTQNEVITGIYIVQIVIIGGGDGWTIEGIIALKK